MKSQPVNELSIEKNTDENNFKVYYFISLFIWKMYPGISWWDSLMIIIPRFSDFDFRMVGKLWIDCESEESTLLMNSLYQIP